MNMNTRICKAIRNSEPLMYALRTYVLNRPVASFWGLHLSFLFPAEPVIQFTKERVFVAGPVVRNAHVEARITVKKTGDPFTRSKVRVYTLDGSAKAGKGYQAMTQVTRQKYFLYVNHLLKRISLLHGHLLPG